MQCGDVKSIAPKIRGVRREYNICQRILDMNFFRKKETCTGIVRGHNIQEKDKLPNNIFSKTNKPDLEPKENDNAFIPNYEIDNFKSDIKLFKHTEPSM